MKQGKSLQELAAELDRQQNAKRDYVADTRALEMSTAEKGASDIQIEGIGEFGVRDNTHRQIATRLKIPAKYYDRLRFEHPEILDQNVNGLFNASPERRMIRTLDDKARAFLSDRYRPLDNFDLAQAVLPILGDVPDMRIESTELTEQRMYIKALFPRTEMEVAKGDVVQAGIVISNSEIGNGSLKVEPLVYRLVCLNGMIANDYSQKKYHVGRAADGGDAAFELYRDETMQADDRALWLKVQDTVRGVAQDVGKFRRIVEGMAQTMEMQIEADPVEVVERVQKAFNLSDDERGGVLRHLIEGGDLTGYGMLNAITRTAQDVESYDRATELERTGGQIITLDRNDWQRLAA